MSIRVRRAHLHSRTHIVGFSIAGAFGFIALLIAALFLSLSALVSGWLQDLPDYKSADAYLVAEPTTVYAADNSVIAEYYLQNRRSVDLNDISTYVIQGTVDVEDERFYIHNGVDPQGILRAIAAQFMGRSEGASTITQQLVRNTVLSDEQFEQSLKRKVREAYIAIQMEKTYTKDQILNMYLNTIYYGHGAYGIQAASITYFNKNASELTLNEAATLIGIPNSPSYYDPTVNMDACIARRNKVLDNMLRLGHISQEEHDQVQAEPITLNLGVFSESQGDYPYFTDYVKQLLLEDFDADTVMQGGLKVYTTLDTTMQKQAQDAVSSQLKAIGNDKLQSALVAVDPSTGYIKAMVGGKDYAISQYNLATQAQRSPGSSFKTVTLVAALQQGMNPTVVLNCNSPMQFTSSWKVGNFGNISYGYLSLQEAFAVSSNTGFVQVIQAIGASNVVSAAKSLGIDVDIPAYDSITLGTANVPVLQMAEAYATIANAGKHNDAIAITRIEDRNGNVVYKHEKNETQAIPTEVASAAIDVMESVTKSGGTASMVSAQTTVDQPFAGKTGTSENFKDLWYCGITPQLSVAVWSGYIDSTPVKVYGTDGHPYSTSIPIYIKFINQALKDAPTGTWPQTNASINYKENSSWTFSQTPAEANSNSWWRYQTTQEEETTQETTEQTTTETNTPEAQNTTEGQTGTTNGTTGGNAGAATGGNAGTGTTTNTGGNTSSPTQNGNAAPGGTGATG